MLIIVNVVYVRGNIVTYIYIHTYRLHRDLIDVAMEFGWITGGGVIVAMDGKSPEEEIDRKEKIHCEKSQWMFC